MIITIYEYNHAIKNNDFEKDSSIKSKILNYINENGFRYCYDIETLKNFNKVMHYIHKTFELDANQSCNLINFRNIN